jgi:hypothetical protein
LKVGKWEVIFEYTSPEHHSTCVYCDDGREKGNFKAEGEKWKGRIGKFSTWEREEEKNLGADDMSQHGIEYGMGGRGI